MDYAQNGYEGMAGYQGSSTGWTAPTVLWERMRDVDVSADALNAAIQKLPTKRQAFLDAWSAWYKHWKDLVARYDSWTAKAAAMTYSDDLASEIEAKRVELHNFEDAYRRERPAGQPENPPLPGMPVKPPDAPKVKGPDFLPKLEIPWWAWVLGVGAMVGTGYLVYNRYKAGRSNPRIAEMSSRYGLPSQASIDRGRGQVAEHAGKYVTSSVGRDASEDVRYAYGSSYGGYGGRMCPCPEVGTHVSATYDPESA